MYTMYNSMYDTVTVDARWGWLEASCRWIGVLGRVIRAVFVDACRIPSGRVFPSHSVAVHNDLMGSMRVEGSLRFFNDVRRGDFILSLLHSLPTPSSDTAHSA